MTIQRAVVKGNMLGVVQFRSMYTCDVVPNGGDTNQLLWQTYLDPIYTDVGELISTGWTADTIELQNYSSGDWVTFDELSTSYAGTATGEDLPNAVSMVLIGKAAGLRHVGRKFFGPITEMVNEGNVIAPAVMIVLGAVLLDYITPFTGIGGGTITPGIVDKNGVFRAFVGGVVSSLLGSMRRRKPGVGI